MPNRTNAATRSAQSRQGLAAVANLGPKSSAVLAQAGVTSLEQLRKLGSVKAFSLAKRVQPSATLNLLWALEGAILGQPWQFVAREHRTSLLLALEDHERGDSRR
jgi:DNA transformation protein